MKSIDEDGKNRGNKDEEIQKRTVTGSMLYRSETSKQMDSQSVGNKEDPTTFFFNKKYEMEMK